jgi:hypothetical protein
VFYFPIPDETTSHSTRIFNQDIQSGYSARKPEYDAKPAGYPGSSGARSDGMLQGKRTSLRVFHFKL